MIIDIRNLYKNYLNGEMEVPVLNDVSLCVDEGEFVSIMGPSGSGKSASLRNFEAGEIGVLNVAGKPLPFRTSIKIADNAETA